MPLTAHMAEHVVLICVVAPLGGLVLSRATNAGRAIAAKERRWWAWVVAAVAVQSAVMLAWHLPGPYQAAVRDDRVHLVEHATFVATAVAFWWVVLADRRRFGAAVVAVFAAAQPGVVLGLLMTVSSTPWYGVYVHGSVAAAIQDQQVAGVVMWGFGGLTYVVAAVCLFAAWLRNTEEEQCSAASRPPSPSSSSRPVPLPAPAAARHGPP